MIPNVAGWVLWIYLATNWGYFGLTLTPGWFPVWISDEERVCKVGQSRIALPTKCLEAGHPPPTPLSKLSFQTMKRMEKSTTFIPKPPLQGDLHHPGR